MTGKFVAYYRVSTQKQGADGLGIAAQKHAVEQYLNGGKWTLVGEFTEVESGKDHKNRPKLEEAINLCKLTKARLIVAKLDRLSRDVEFLARMMKSSVKFVACDLPEANELTIHIMAAVAQQERQRISERIRGALAEIKSGRRQSKSGYRSVTGAPLGPTAKGRDAIRAKSGYLKGAAATKRKANEFKERVGTVVDALVQKGMNQTQIAVTLNTTGITTSTGTKWSQGNVSNLLKRMGKEKGR